MGQLFFISPKLPKPPWGLCPQTPEVFRFEPKLMSLGQKTKRLGCSSHRGGLALRLNFGIQSRSSCASAELYPAPESPAILPTIVLLSTPPPHYSHFDPTIPLILIRPQQLKSRSARTQARSNYPTPLLTPVQGATVLQGLARLYEMAIQGATQGATKCYIGCYIFKTR
jgi:hypothetical protein